MLFGGFASRVLLARFTGALMKRFRFMLVHSSTCFFIRSSDQVGITGMSLMQNRQVVFRQTLSRVESMTESSLENCGIADRVRHPGRAKDARAAERDSTIKE